MNPTPPEISNYFGNVENDDFFSQLGAPSETPNSNINTPTPQEEEKPKTPPKRFKNGLHSITSTRRTPTATAPGKSNQQEDGRIGVPMTTLHVPAPNEDDGHDGPAQPLFHNTDWTAGFRLKSFEELENIEQCPCCLLLRTGNANGEQEATDERTATMIETRGRMNEQKSAKSEGQSE